MTKEDMVQVLRSVGCDENTVTAMQNAYEMGAEHTRETIIAKNAPELAHANAYIALLEAKVKGTV